MLKGYIGRWRKRENDQRIMDYCFTSRPENAASWDTRQEAENDCILFNRNRIVIPSSEGGTYVCHDFKAEERAPDEFVIFCIAPFIPDKTRTGQSTQK
jgi:hypothetical protein